MYNLYTSPQLHQVPPRNTEVVYNNDTNITMDVILSSSNCTLGIPWVKMPENRQYYMCERRIVYPNTEVRFPLVGPFNGILSQSYQPTLRSAYNFMPVNLRERQHGRVYATRLRREGELHNAPA